MAQVAQSKTKMGGSGAGGAMLQSFATQALSFAAIGGGAMFAAPAMGLASGMMGGLPGLGHHASGPTMTYVYGLPGRGSALALPAGSKFDVQYGDIVGLDPDSYEVVLLKLVQSKDNYRLIGANHQKMDLKGGETDWVSDEQRIPAKITKIGRGHVQIEASAPLESGEYGLALRTVKHKTKSASAYGMGIASSAESLKATVWDFSVR